MSEQMRKEFEAWCSDSTEREKDGSYKQPFTRAYWKAWQAALATQPQAPQGADYKTGVFTPPHEEDADGHLRFEEKINAARWNMLPAFLEKYQIDYVALLADIDAVLARPVCMPDYCETASECDSLGCRIERNFSAAPETPEGQKP